MDLLDAIQANLVSPPVLFFALGLFAAILKSDLKFPEQLYLGLTIYLLVAIGLKGGVAFAEAGFANVWKPSLAAILLGTLIPLWTYPVARWFGRLSVVDAAALAAHYGSVSAVTFIAATAYLGRIGVAFESYAPALLAVMESPAILVGVLIGKVAAPATGAGTGGPLKSALHDAMFGRSVLLLVGALVIGALCGAPGVKAVEPFFVTPFHGVLAMFLLEMGIVAGRRIGDLRKVGLFLLGFGIAAPVVNGALGAWFGHMAGLGVGGSALLGVLAGSASYIAAPAAVRLALPEANPTLYLTAALAITFPFNLVFGIPYCLGVARLFNQ